MNIFQIITPITYWLLIVMWAYILFFLMRRFMSNHVERNLIKTLIIILAVDAFRTLFESIFFGVRSTSLSGFLPIGVYDFLVRSEIVFIPKFLNVIVATFIIGILLYKWFPAEKRDRELLESTIEENINELEKRNKQLRYEINERKQAEKELQKYRENLEELVKEHTTGLEEKTAKLEKSQQSITLLLKDVNESRSELEESNKELQGKTITLEKFQKSLILLLEDVNESRAELDISNKGLENLNKELEAFSYSVSHDLRAPLRHIDGFTKLFYNSIKHKIDERSQKYFDNIINSSKQMNQLIDDLLIFAKMSRKDIKKTKINMKTIINETRETFDLEIKENNISFIVDDMPEVKLDTAMIRQVWENLISNAVKFTGNKKNPKIHIGADKDADDKTFFFIKDNGIGFNQKYVDKIFGVFQRLHNSNEFPGTGIGLANVKRIILKHGGEIRAEGKVNKGASFFFTLPDV